MSDQPETASLAERALAFVGLQQRPPLNWTAGAALFEALAKAQAETENPAFDSTNPHFKTPYASLAAVRNAVIPPFAKHGLAIFQDVTVIPGAVRIVTIVTHSSGEWMQLGPLDMPLAKLDSQGVGAAESYGRRYALLALGCVSGERDEDAEPIVDRDVDKRTPDADSALVRPAQLTILRAKLSKAGIDEKALCTAHKVESLDLLPFDAVNAALKWIDEQKKS